MKLSDKIESIEGSKTVAFTALIQQLRQEGREIIDLAVGEPQFDTPAPVIAFELLTGTTPHNPDAPPGERTLQATHVYAEGGSPSTDPKSTRMIRKMISSSDGPRLPSMI